MFCNNHHNYGEGLQIGVSSDSQHTLTKVNVEWPFSMYMQFLFSCILGRVASTVDIMLTSVH